MKKEYAYILITYIAMQLSGYIGYPIVYSIGVNAFDVSAKEMKIMTPVYWIVISFFAALIIVLFILRKSEKKYKMERTDALPIIPSIIWAFVGIFLAFFAQALASMVEQLLGIKMESENTQRIIGLIETFPLMIVVSSVVGPILEEIVFRKIIFGSFHKRFSFFISALLSSIIFGIVHMELEHVILYSAMGFTFAFLYKQTKRIIVPIIAHVMMNTLVVVIQLLNQDQIQKTLDYYQKVQSFIGGFFS